MRKAVIAVCLIAGLALETQAQVTEGFIVCRNGVCIVVPPPVEPTPPAPLAATQAKAIVPETVTSTTNHTKAIVITAIVSAVGTWALVKLVKRGKRK